MNYFTIKGNPPAARGKRKRTCSQMTDGRQFVEGQEDELINRSLREKIELAVDECCVWPE